ncbi:tRNA (adenosine(37)-N6)-threonylcarbamoyltransferase complex dimerization subunit type 1 TsaB [Capilliphycus salinus ALCB114379]|uniref:tRNA (adenosine(37)-N6)-threonylcarbamoyltransferase complex dimerization subunit type 1 TsaB n=1 Tax=Capilliphycus salinus TaxID=2768948 RepID=UPI0039A5EC6D
MPSDSLKYGLAIHTSSPELGLAVGNFTEEIRYQSWNLGRDLSVQLHQYLAEFIQPQTWSDFKLIAVAKGPGSFTGTRMGVVTARILAQQLEIPLFSISTLAGMAWQIFPKDATLSDNLALQMPAQRGQFFVAIYGKQETLIEYLPDSVMSLEAWQTTLEKWKNPYKLIKLEGGLGDSAMSLLELAHLDFQQGKRPHWSEALPFYGQHPVD